MSKREDVYGNHAKGYYEISEERRNEYRRVSEESRKRKQLALIGKGSKPLHQINVPKLDPNQLMQLRRRHKLTALSLFSGGGGLDLAFDRSGFKHVASYEIIDICGKTLKKNRPRWNIFSGIDDGDVRNESWTDYKNKVDVIHGGPPCQPFSIAGQQKGLSDDRNMWDQFVRSINTIKPRAFVGENVLGLLDNKFESFVNSEIIEPLKDYKIVKFQLRASDFGVPQIRRRVFFVGFKNANNLNKFVIPTPTHNANDLVEPDLFSSLDTLPNTMGVREALGLPDIGIDGLASTLRSGFTGKRNTTSILNSKASEKAWAKIKIWGNGVQKTREEASKFTAKNGHFRLSVNDCALIQGFPENWSFSGAVYQILGQIGNSVSPVVGYAVANAVRKALL